MCRCRARYSDISFRLHKGEILGIGGLSECGMHEAGKAIFGASYGRSGSVTLKDGYAVKSIPGAIRHSIAYASKDRDNESVVIADSIRDNICLPSLNDMSRHALLSNKKLDGFAQKNAELMSVKMTGIDQYVSTLSGGNKQKVVISRWLGKDSDILVLDSPTRGIDVKVKADIYALMSELKTAGQVDHHDLRGAAGAARDERPHTDNERRQDQRRVYAESGSWRKRPDHQDGVMESCGMEKQGETTAA